MRGRSNRMMATTMIEPAMGRVKKIAGEPCAISSDWRIDASASGPSTMASTAGAIG